MLIILFQVNINVDTVNIDAKIVKSLLCNMLKNTYFIV